MNNEEELRRRLDVTEKLLAAAGKELTDANEALFRSGQKISSASPTIAEHIYALDRSRRTVQRALKRMKLLARFWKTNWKQDMKVRKP